MSAEGAEAPAPEVGGRCQEEPQDGREVPEGLAGQVALPLQTLCPVFPNPHILLLNHHLTIQRGHICVFCFELLACVSSGASRPDTRVSGLVSKSPFSHSTLSTTCHITMFSYLPGGRDQHPGPLPALSLLDPQPKLVPPQGSGAGQAAGDGVPRAPEKTHGCRAGPEEKHHRQPGRCPHAHPVTSLPTPSGPCASL